MNRKDFEILEQFIKDVNPTLEELADTILKNARKQGDREIEFFQLAHTYIAEALQPIIMGKILKRD